MHNQVIDFVRESMHQHGLITNRDVLDVGGRDVNGGIRQHLGELRSYKCVDLLPGEGVDVVGDIVNLNYEQVADIVLCLEVLEHVDQWERVVGACVRACRLGGGVIITAAGFGRQVHSAVDGGPVLYPGETYRNIDVGELAKLMDALCHDVKVIWEPHDVRAFGRRRGA